MEYSVDDRALPLSRDLFSLRTVNSAVYQGLVPRDLHLGSTTLRVKFLF